MERQGNVRQKRQGLYCFRFAPSVDCLFDQRPSHVVDQNRISFFVQHPLHTFDEEI